MFPCVRQVPALTRSSDRAPSQRDRFRFFHSIPLVSYCYALFCATGDTYLPHFQPLPHSFYRDGGVGGLCVKNSTTAGLSPIPYTLSPFFSHSCVLSCTFLHSSKAS